MENIEADFVENRGVISHSIWRESASLFASKVLEICTQCDIGTFFVGSRGGEWALSAHRKRAPDGPNRLPNRGRNGLRFSELAGREQDRQPAFFDTSIFAKKRLILALQISRKSCTF